MRFLVVAWVFSCAFGYRRENYEVLLGIDKANVEQGKANVDQDNHGKKTKSAENVFVWHADDVARMFLADAPDTCADLSEEDVQRYVDGHLHGLSPPPQEATEYAVFVAGGPGAGKTATRTKMLTMLANETGSPTFVQLDVDEQLENLFDNNMNCYGLVQQGEAWVVDDPESFRGAFYAQLALQEKIFGKYNLVYDGTGKDDMDFAVKARETNEKGYKRVAMGLTICEPEVAWGRVQKRAVETGRDVDKWYFDFVYEEVNADIEKYFATDAFTDIMVYDNTLAGQEAKLVVSKKDGVLTPTETCGEGNTWWWCEQLPSLKALTN